jgi:hypothetical protein
MKSESIPTLTLTNGRAKIITVERSDSLTGETEAIAIHGHADITLHHGDVIKIVHGTGLM